MKSEKNIFRKSSVRLENLQNKLTQTDDSASLWDLISNEYKSLLVLNTRKNEKQMLLHQDGFWTLGT